MVQGGSSTGEAALIAMRGSVVGMAVDNGGSIRIPVSMSIRLTMRPRLQSCTALISQAAYNGLYGLKASCDRLPYMGMPECESAFTEVPEQWIANGTSAHQVVCHHIQIASGPMRASVDGLRIVTKAILDAKPWDVDPTCLRMPWSEEAYRLHDWHPASVLPRDKDGDIPSTLPKLSFAIMWDDGCAMPDPPYRRALGVVKEALQTAGHEVLDWVPYKSAESYELGVSTVLLIVSDPPAGLLGISISR